MKKKNIYIIIGIVTLIIKLAIEFQTSLIPGINGAYYPVQIREIINSWKMAIPDMPFVFYLNALLVKIVSFFVSNNQSDIIINVVKIFGSFTIPLLLIPIYQISEKLTNKNISRLFEYSLVAFITLSFSPLLFSSEAMKNALGLSFMTFFMYHFLQYIKSKNRKELIISILFLLLIAITHFGVFSISILFFMIGIMIVYKRKAIIPIIITAIVGFSIILIFDSSRAHRLLFIWGTVFSFPYSLFRYLPGLINLLYSIFIIKIIIRILKKQKNEISEVDKQYLRIFLYFIIILAFPLYTFEFGRRLGLMLFIPQTIVLFFAYPYLKSSLKKIIPIVAIILVSYSLIYNYTNPKPAAITQEAYNDLKNLSKKISEPDKTIIYTRHGMEWWIVWELKTKIAHSYIEIDEQILSKYNDVLLLSQKKGINNLYPFKSKAFEDPDIPENSKLIISTEYYDLYKYINKK